MKYRQIIYSWLTLSIVGFLFASCDKYYYNDKLQDLGARVEILEQRAFLFNQRLQNLQTILQTFESNGLITNIQDNADGTYTLTFSNGKTVTIRNGKDGEDGNDDVFSLSAKKGDDGYWYWTINGEFLLDGNGNKIRAGGIDGKDGDNAVSNLDATCIPLVRINASTLCWEISTDGGTTWTPTDIKAVGKNGEHDIFQSVTLSADHSMMIFVFRGSGESFSIPVNQISIN